MEIVRQEHRLLLVNQEEQVGTLDFVCEGGRMRINHVGVLPAYRGQSLAKRLVDAAVRFAREENMTIVPVCPYAQAVLARDKTAADILYKENDSAS